MIRHMIWVKSSNFFGLWFFMYKLKETEREFIKFFCLFYFTKIWPLNKMWIDRFFNYLFICLIIYCSYLINLSEPDHCFLFCLSFFSLISTNILSPTPSISPFSSEKYRPFMYIRQSGHIKLH